LIQETEGLCQETSTINAHEEPTGHPEGTRTCEKCEESLPYKRFSYNEKGGKRYYGKTCYSCKKNSKERVSVIRTEGDWISRSSNINQIRNLYLLSLRDHSVWADVIGCVPELIEGILSYRKAIEVAMRKNATDNDVMEVLPDDEYKLSFGRRNA